MPQTTKHAIIACHPSERSFTCSVAEKYAETVRAHGHTAIVRNLYQIGFDPVLREEERSGRARADVSAEWALLGKSDAFVLVYPVWFGAPPAMLVGYIDRVFGAGRTRGLDGDAGPGELLAGKHLVSLTSSGSMRAWLDERGVLNSLRTVYDRYLAEVFGFVETARYHYDGIVAELPEREFEQHMFEVAKAAREVMSRLTPTWQPPGETDQSRGG